MKIISCEFIAWREYRAADVARVQICYKRGDGKIRHVDCEIFQRYNRRYPTSTAIQIVGLLGIRGRAWSRRYAPEALEVIRECLLDQYSQEYPEEPLIVRKKLPVGSVAR